LAYLSVLAFDYGTKNIGIAFGQNISATASELAAIPAKDGIPNWSTIETLIKEWKPDLAIVGLPLNMDDTESELSTRARKFANRLHGRFGLKVELYDERLTTKMAKEEARDRGHKGYYAKNPIDSIAARLMLEGWFYDNPKSSS
jgi:putative Holliday junction resolvase